MRFTDDEWMLMMLYSPGTRTGLIEELQKMQKSLTGRDRNVWKLYESIMCVYFDMEEIIKQAVYLQGAYDRERMLK